jgi:hypothetical protein
MRVACRCAAVEIEISGEPVAQFYRPCDDCQIVHGGAQHSLTHSSANLSA